MPRAKRPQHPETVIPAPLDVPEEATHFRLRKGGRQGIQCVSSGKNGVETIIHEIALFTAGHIRDQWGPGDYWCSFLRVEDGRRHILGAPKYFGLSDARARRSEGEHAEESAPAGPVAATSTLSETLTLLSRLDAMTQARTRETIESERERTRLAIESERIRSTETIAVTRELTRMFIERAAVPPPAPPAPPPESSETLALLRQLATGQEALTARLEALEEEEEEEEETDDERIERLEALVLKRGALVAVKEYMNEESASTVVRLLPKIGQKIPQVLALLQGVLGEGLKELAKLATPAPAAAPAPPPAAAKAPAIAPKAEEVRAPKRNGAAAATAPRAPSVIEPDEHTPLVS
jgi:hypothetical protein